VVRRSFPMPWPRYAQEPAAPLVRGREEEQVVAVVLIDELV